MHPALVFEPLVNVPAGDLENDFLVTAQIGRTGVQAFAFPPPRLGVPRVHPIEIGGKQGGFLPAGARANFKNGVARVRRVRWQNAALNLLAQAPFLRLEPGDFFPGHLRQFGLGRLGLQQGAILRKVRGHFPVSVAVPDKFLQPGIFAGQFLGTLRMIERLGIAQGRFHFREAARELFDLRC